MAEPLVAVVDYGLGNLFSVKHALEHCGARALITNEAQDLLNADALVLPGVGAFGDAMAALRQLDLIETLRSASESGRPFLGICLGLQLLMSKSYEFGEHEGLGILTGDVQRLDNPTEGGRPLKVPRVGWETVYPKDGDPLVWNDTPLKRTAPGSYMYFVHSYHVVPRDPSIVVAHSRYGDLEYCSGVCLGNVFGLQFHPERSGTAGLEVYRQLTEMVRSRAGVSEIGGER